MNLFQRVRTHRLIAALATCIWSACIASCANQTEDSLNGGDLDGDDASFTDIYNSSQFQRCKGCHAPNAPGRTAGTESTQNWSSRDSAYTSLKGNAAGLMGNFAGCNGVPLLARTAEDSLLVAAFDEDVRADFSVSNAPDCTADAISDMTLKIGGPLPSGLLEQLKSWVNAGAPDN